MKTLYSILIICIPSILFSQAAKIVSSYCFGSNNSELCNDISPSYDGNFWLAGFSDYADGDVTGNNGYYDYWVCKVNSTGGVISQDNFGGSGDDFAESIEETSDSGRIILGTSYSVDGDITGAKGAGDFWLLRLKKNGTFKWKKNFGGSAPDVAGQLSKSSDGGYFCAGKTNSKNGNVSGKHKLYDAWVIKVDDYGTLLWQICLGGAGDDDAQSVYATADGGCIIAGSATSGGGDATGWHGGKDFFIAKLSAAGLKEWSACYGGSSDDFATSIKQTSDGGYIATGYTNSFDGNVVGGKGYGDVWVIKLSSVGAIEWQHVYGGSAGFEQGSDIISTADGGYAIAAYLDAYSNSLTGSDFTTYHNYYDPWIIKINASGAIEWNGTYGGPGNDVPFSILQNAAGEFMVAGYAGLNGCDIDDAHGIIAGYGDFWLLRLGDNGCNRVSDMNATSAFGYATMSWCPAAGAVSYELRYRESGGSWLTYTTYNGNEYSHSISVLPLTTYEWKVKTNCATGYSTFTPVQTFTTPARNGEIIPDNSLHIFPDPAHENIFVQFENDFIPNEIFISDISGRVIDKIIPEVNSPIEFNISNYPNGSYFLIAISDHAIAKQLFLKE